MRRAARTSTATMSPIPPLSVVAPDVRDGGGLAQARAQSSPSRSIPRPDAMKMRERAIDAAARETGLPVADPVRFGAGPLLDALLAHA